MQLTTVSIQTDGEPFDFVRAKSVSDAVASAVLGESTCLSWYDRKADFESPAHVSECHGTCDVPGYVDYAVNRGAELRTVVGDGDFVYMYRPLGEFAGL